MSVVCEVKYAFGQEVDYMYLFRQNGMPDVVLSSTKRETLHLLRDKTSWKYKRKVVLLPKISNKKAFCWELTFSITYMY